MSFFGKPERNVIAQQIANNLNLYQLSMDEWVLDPGQQRAYDKLNGQFESIRLLSSSALPQATGALAGLVSAHADLTFSVLKKHLVKLGAIPESDERLAEAQQKHRLAVSDMQALCVRLAGKMWFRA